MIEVDQRFLFGYVDSLRAKVVNMALSTCQVLPPTDLPLTTRSTLGPEFTSAPQMVNFGRRGPGGSKFFGELQNQLRKVM